MLLTPTQVQVTLDRQQDARAAIARECLFAGTTQAPPSITPRLVGRIRAGRRVVVASLVALTTIG